MRVIVLGGTRFLGRALVADLRDAGHEVLVVHRGRHEDGDDGARHLHADRRDLDAHSAELRRFRPDAAIDMAAMTEEDAKRALRALGDVPRLVVASSGDVYRACASVAAGRVTDPVPLAEDAPLRDGPTPDRDVVLPGWDYDPAEYEKLDVERRYREHGGIVCRLPMAYGEHDYKRREEFVLRRVRAGRGRIPVGAGTFLWSRGHAPELARGMRLALERGDPGETFNLAEPTCASIRLWVEEILAAAGHEAELVTVPDDALPDDLALTASIPQHWLLDSTRAATHLGWAHADWRACVQHSVRWHLANPPADPGSDFEADDRALAAVV